MQYIHALIETIRQALIENQTHDAILDVAPAAIPLLLVLWIVHRMRHPARSFLNALGIALLGFLLVPLSSLGIGWLWRDTGGDFNQAVGVTIALFILGFWMFRRWLRSAPRVTWITKPVIPPPELAISESNELSELRAEVARLRAERPDKDAGGEQSAPSPTVH